jgi:hypothetical protein
VGLERGPLSLVSITEELLDRKVAAPVYKTENTAIGIRHADHVAHSIRKKLAITSPTSGGRSVGTVRSRTQTMEFSLVLGKCCNYEKGVYRLSIGTLWTKVAVLWKSIACCLLLVCFPFGLLDPDDGGDVRLTLSADYIALFPRKKNSSLGHVLRSH